MTRYDDKDNDKKIVRRRLSATDMDLWAFVIRQVQPLVKEEQPINPAKKKLQFQKKRLTGIELPDDVPFRSGAKPDTSLDRRTENRFRKGKMPIEATLDLHGMTQAQAQPALSRFIKESYSQGFRCLLVITGKGQDGQGVLRQLLPEWLLSPIYENAILKFVQARPQHGGTGAFYILLRRVR